MNNDKDNKMILQSYTLTAIRNDFGIYAQRLICRIAERMQYRLEDADFTKDIVKPSDQRLYWNFRTTEIMNEGDTNYNAVKRELHKAIKASVFFEDKDHWQESMIFTDIWTNKAGEIKVKINDTLWNLFIEFSKGYKRYNLASAMKLKSTYALRLYQLLSENATPITYTIDWLKQMFQVQSKWNRTRDFVSKAIAPAVKEINENCPMKIEYTPVTKIEGKGRPSITAITFKTIKVKKTEKVVDTDTQRRYGKSLLSKETRYCLENMYEFTEKGIETNAFLFADAERKMKNPDLHKFLADKRAKAMKAKNPKGWIINAIKSELETIDN